MGRSILGVIGVAPCVAYRGLGDSGAAAERSKLRVLGRVGLMARVIVGAV